MKRKNSSNNKLFKQQKKFIESVEGLGDILTFLTESKRNPEVIPTLRDLSDLLQSLLDIKKSNPEKFEKLMLAEEFWNLQEVDKNEAELRLGFYPEKYLITFSVLLQQIIRVF